jgi:hypothetical protein
VTSYRTCRVCGSARECRGIGKEDREILGSKAGDRRRRDMISCRKGARSNLRDEIDMRLPYVCDRVFFERRKGDGKEAISSSLLGKVTMMMMSFICSSRKDTKGCRIGISNQ